MYAQSRTLPSSSASKRRHLTPAPYFVFSAPSAARTSTFGGSSGNPYFLTSAARGSSSELPDLFPFFGAVGELVDELGAERVTERRVLDLLQEHVIQERPRLAELLECLALVAPREGVEVEDDALAKADDEHGAVRAFEPGAVAGEVDLHALARDATVFAFAVAALSLRRRGGEPHDHLIDLVAPDRAGLSSGAGGGGRKLPGRKHDAREHCYRVQRGSPFVYPRSGIVTPERRFGHRGRGESRVIQFSCSSMFQHLTTETRRHGGPRRTTDGLGNGVTS